jgi:hypothetical protein
MNAPMTRHTVLPQRRTPLPVLASMNLRHRGASWAFEARKSPSGDAASADVRPQAPRSSLLALPERHNQTKN